MTQSNVQALKPSERRRSNRIAVRTKVQPGIMMAKATNKKLQWYAFNVSKIGIGISVVGDMVSDLELRFELGGKKYDMELRWGVLDVKRQEYRYGLECINEDCDLTELFREYRFIR